MEMVEIIFLDRYEVPEWDVVGDWRYMAFTGR